MRTVVWQYVVQEKGRFPVQETDLVVAGAGFEPATFGLCVPTTIFIAGQKAVCGLDFLFTLG